jgi:starch synthase
MRVVMIASEAVPFSKTGGLADVLGALPRALIELGHDVTLVTPRYRGTPPGDVVARFDVSLGGHTLPVEFHRSGAAALVDAPTLYDREGLYGIANDDYPDNAFRFAFLVKAALELVGRTFDRVDIVHAHDWQAGLAPVYLKTLYATHPVLAGAASILTIHNLAYQGLFPAGTLPALDLPWPLFAVEGLEYWGRISFLKAGINFSEIITTVSPTYAAEIQTPEYGFGFDGILRRRSRELVGILNGIDHRRWDPTNDPALPAPFDAAHLEGKQDAKRAVLAAFGMPGHSPALARPLVGIVSRMVDQKGFDLLSASMNDLLRLDCAYVLLGSGSPAYERGWRDLAARHPDRVGVRIGFDESLAHLIEGGSDIFLMPSRFEPCGLNQMYSLRYGTVPVVRAVGGLEDSVEDYRASAGTGTGFKFRAYTGVALVGALRSALEAYRQPDRWRAIQAAGMQRDHSWNASAQKYVKVYERAARRRLDASA